MVAFIRTMPHHNAWNGKWTGDGELFARVHPKPRGAKATEKYQNLIGRHRYDFGDGWVACIEVVEVGTSEGRKMKKQSRGFWGYDWMIDSLLQHGVIQT